MSNTTTTTTTEALAISADLLEDLRSDYEFARRQERCLAADLTAEQAELLAAWISAAAAAYGLGRLDVINAEDRDEARARVLRHIGPARVARGRFRRAVLAA